MSFSGFQQTAKTSAFSDDVHLNKHIDYQHLGATYPFVDGNSTVDLKVSRTCTYSSFGVEAHWTDRQAVAKMK